MRLYTFNNVLNHIPVKLNGPAHMVEISED